VTGTGPAGHPAARHRETCEPPRSDTALSRPSWRMTPSRSLTSAAHREFAQGCCNRWW